MSKTVVSLIRGRALEGSPGGTLRISNPANLDEQVAEAHLGDATTFVEACRTAREEIGRAHV